MDPTVVEGPPGLCRELTVAATAGPVLGDRWAVGLPPFKVNEMDETTKATASDEKMLLLEDHPNQSTASGGFGQNGARGAKLPSYES